jgi:membrane-bound ClpP family serine protease
VVSEGGFIGKGTPVKVINAEGARVVVRATKPADGGTS